VGGNVAAGQEPVPLWMLVRAEARIGLRGVPLRIALLFSALLGWVVGNTAGSGAGLSALGAGDAASTYLALVAVYWLSMAAARDSAVSATAIVLSKPQPTERLVSARFWGAYLQMLSLLLALFVGAALSRWLHAGSVAGSAAYIVEFMRAAVVLFFASSAAYALALLAATPLAGALAGMYWIVTLAGQDYLAKIYYPYYTQNLAAYAFAGLFVLSLAALCYRRSRRGSVRPSIWYQAAPWVTLICAAFCIRQVIVNGHDPLMLRSPMMEEIGRQDATMFTRSPGFTLPDQHGRLVSLSDTPGRVFIIALIDPRSEEGVLLLDHMRDMHRKYGDRGVLPVAVCIANDEGAARVVAMGEGVNYPVLVDWGSHHAPRAADASPLAGAFRVNDMPYVAVTDRRRRIRAIIEGISTYDGQLLENAVRDRLDEEPE